MLHFNRRLLKFWTGKQVTIYGNSISIGKALDVGEVYPSNILAPHRDPNLEQKIQNLQSLSPDEIAFVVDYMTGFRLQLKQNIRK